METHGRLESWLRSKVEQINHAEWDAVPYRLLPDGTMLHVPTGDIYRAEDGMLLSDEAVNALNVEIILDDILDAEEIG